MLFRGPRGVCAANSLDPILFGVAREYALKALRSFSIIENISAIHSVFQGDAGERS